MESTVDPCTLLQQRQEVIVSDSETNRCLSAGLLSDTRSIPRSGSVLRSMPSNDFKCQAALLHSFGSQLKISQGISASSLCQASVRGEAANNDRKKRPCCRKYYVPVFPDMSGPSNETDEKYHGKHEVIQAPTTIISNQITQQCYPVLTLVA